MEAESSKASLYVEDFMTKEEEDYKLPYPVTKSKESFKEKKNNFSMEKVLKEFVLK